MTPPPEPRLHILHATDWKDAVIALLEPRSPYRPWRSDYGSTVEGSVLAYVLDTDPPTILTIFGRMGADGAAFDHSVQNSNLLELSSLAMLFGLEWAVTDSWHLVGEDVVTLEDALTASRFGSRPESRFGHSTMAAARILLRYDGTCDGCEETIDISGSDAREEIFAHTVDLPSRKLPMTQDWTYDWPAVICRKCLQAMAEGGFTSFLDFKFGLHPPCPRCAARRTQRTFYGMPSDFGNIEPWNHAGGCCPSSESWRCGMCGIEW
ncbi:hypothetical protein [Mycobacterium sp. NPDC006124]|uniref:hypothetical protein n=1 Tax=Mycobacterium sp. NPDC006124 TaxID=3156729 RepID=UPI00339E8899